jgi:Tfp pilus assembly protein PilF
MSAARMRLLVLGIAIVAALVVVGVVLATRQDSTQPTAQCNTRPKPLIVPGVPSQNVAAVRRALKLPPKQAAHALEQLALRNPKDAVVQFNFGTVLFCAGFLSDADSAFRQAKKAGYDTYYEIQSDSILHPQFFQQGYPIFEAVGDVPLLVQGQLMQRRGKQHSAEKLYARAARLEPNNDQAQVAAAVGRFDEDNLTASFSRLGPLVKRFPHSQTVRFHLGLLLAWTGQRTEAVKQFELARSLGAKTQLGKEASAFLRGVSPSGSTGSAR